MSPDRRPLLALALLAALLGGAGAVGAEVVFTRRLALLFGVTAPAAATVVAVYMGGMAVGAGIGGRLADRFAARAGWLYAGAEVVGAGLALAFLGLMGAVEGALDTLPTGLSLLGCALGTAVLVGPAAVASGATFPALARQVGRADLVRVLYAANAGGAAIGALLAGLYGAEVLGLQGTLLVAAGLMAAAGLCGLLMARGGAPDTAQVPASAPGQVSLREATLAYAVVGGTGMGAEIGWTRLLEQSGPNPGALCFPIVLAGFLVGIGVGGAVLEPRLRRLGERTALTIAAALTGAAVCIAIGLLPVIPEERLIGHLVGPGPGNAVIFDLTGVQVSVDRLALVLGGVGLPGLASGVAFPIATGAIARERGGARLGGGAGRAASAGILSAMAVSLWMGFLPAPGPGTVRLLVLLGVTALATSAVLARRPAMALLPALGALAFLVPPWAGLQIPPDETVDAFVETAAGPSAAATGPEGGSVYTHGERVGGMQLDLELPLILHPAPAETLVIAFGTGINIRGFAQDEGIERLTCVDIDPALPELARNLPWGDTPFFDGERTRYVVADGRHLLRSDDATYDIIYSDVATYAQYVSLGTVEFFALTRQRLAPGGMFALKLHPDTLTEEGLRRFLASFMEVYPEAAVFAPRTHLPVLVGFTGPLPDLAALEARKAAAPTLLGGSRPASLPSRVMLGPPELRRAVEGVAPATDDRPLSLRRALVGPMAPSRLHGAAVHTLSRMVREADRDMGEKLFGWAPDGWDRWQVPGAMAVKGRRNIGQAP